MGIQALMRNEKIPGHYMDLVYVIPGIGIFSNTGVWCGPA